MAEIQILRKKISALQDQVTALSSRPGQLFPSPLLTTATIEPPRIQHTTLKVHTSLCISLCVCVCVCTCTKKVFYSVLETPSEFKCTCV